MQLDNTTRIIPNCEYVIKKTYKALKLRRLFSIFMNSSTPLQNVTYLNYHNYGNDLKINKELRINIKDKINYDNIFVDIKILTIMLLHASLNYPFRINKMANEISSEILVDAFINDELVEYKKTHKVIPNHMVYGFKYGTITTIIGLLIMFCLMLYFFSPLNTLILFGAYSLLIIIAIIDLT